MRYRLYNTDSGVSRICSLLDTLQVGDDFVGYHLKSLKEEVLEGLNASHHAGHAVRSQGDCLLARHNQRLVGG